MRIILWILTLLLLIIGVIVSVYFFNDLYKEYDFVAEGPILLDKTGQVGDFIGGVVGTLFSLAGFITLIITLSSQNRSSYIEQFESKFFELLRIHRENVREIVIKRNVFENEFETKNVVFEGRQSFKIIQNDFASCRNEIKYYFDKFEISEIYEPDYLTETINIFSIDETHIRLKSIAKINIAYCIVFYGVGKEGFNILDKIFNTKYKPEFYKPLLNYIKMKPAVDNIDYWKRWIKFKSIRKMNDRIDVLNKILQLRKSRSNLKKNENKYYYDNNYIKYYGGHQHRLGHYFRHLFQTVSFVNSQSELSFQEKYFYVKTLRAQLSIYEQSLLFVNSLSSLGLAWEFKPVLQKSSLGFLKRNKLKDNQLISNYNLIKNLPDEDILGIVYTHYYPNVKYEIPRKHSS